MINVKAIDELAERLTALLPKDLLDAREDLSRNVRTLLHAGFQKMDLVTREEFEVQRAVLTRTREKLEALEARLAELEAGAE